MVIREAKGEVMNLIPIKNVLISVYDKSDLDRLVPSLLEQCGDVNFFSTGGTYSVVKEILGDRAEELLVEVSDYTNFPEMEGGLVKTLHPKIHAGILGERNNIEHQRYLKDDLDNAVYIDAVVVNLYPFKEVISKEDVTLEKARGNIDIGGPTMIRGAAKNYLGCAVISSTEDCGSFAGNVIFNRGSTDLRTRFELARNTFRATAKYDNQIANYLENQDINDPSLFSDYKLI